jgi:hypothetical protein
MPVVALAAGTSVPRAVVAQGSMSPTETTQAFERTSRRLQETSHALKGASRGPDGTSRVPAADRGLEETTRAPAATGSRGGRPGPSRATAGLRRRCEVARSSSAAPGAEDADPAGEVGWFEGGED